MLSLKRLLKQHAETGAPSEHVPLYGWIDKQTFLTKGGDVGQVLKVEGVDYECLGKKEIKDLTGRLETALKAFQNGGRVYQYLFKRSHPDIPHETYGNPVVDKAIERRIAHFRQRAASVYTIEIYYVLMYDGLRHKAGITDALAAFFTSPKEGALALRALFSDDKQITLIRSEIDRGHATLLHRVQAFVGQTGDFLACQVLPKAEAFRVLSRLVNFDPKKADGGAPSYDTHTDFFLPRSSIDFYKGHVMVDDYTARILTLREPTSQSWPLILQELYEIPGNYHIVTEWRPIPNAEAKSRITSKRRLLHNSKTSLLSLMAQPGEQVLVDDAKTAHVETLSECLKELDFHGNHFGELSLTAVVYDKNPETVERSCADFHKVFNVHDGTLIDERWNLPGAFWGTLPGNHLLNLRRLELVLNKNYADYSFLFHLSAGELRNAQLGTEYLALFETRQGTLFFFNLHTRDLAHTAILGRIGSGKSFTGGFLLTNLQKYNPFTFIFELGSGFQGLTRLFGGAYMKLGESNPAFRINPFVLEPTKENLNFLFAFLRVLLESDRYTMTSPEEKDLYAALGRLYELDPEVRRLGTLRTLLRKPLGERLHLWTEGGPYDFCFDNLEDTVTFSRMQGFDFEEMKKYPLVVEPLLFYLLHRANSIICDPKHLTTFKVFFMDEVWAFLKHPTTAAYFVEAMRTWRKKNAAMIFATQSVDEIVKSESLNAILESCPTKLFLANPDMDPQLYAEKFHLNDTELELLAGLIPKRQLLLKRTGFAKVLELNVDPLSYWIYTNDPQDNARRDEAFRVHGFEHGLEALVGTSGGSEIPVGTAALAGLAARPGHPRSTT